MIEQTADVLELLVANDKVTLDPGRAPKDEVSTTAAELQAIAARAAG
ncbi:MULTISPECIES: hypothetical protein [Streptomyces]